MHAVKIGASNFVHPNMKGTISGMKKLAFATDPYCVQGTAATDHCCGSMPKKSGSLSWIGCFTAAVPKRRQVWDIYESLVRPGPAFFNPLPSGAVTLTRQHRARTGTPQRLRKPTTVNVDRPILCATPPIRALPTATTRTSEINFSGDASA